MQQPIKQPEIMALGHDFGLDSFQSSAGDFAEGYKELSHSRSIKQYSHKNRCTDVDELYSNDRVLQKIICTPVFDALANWRNIEGNATLSELDQQFELVELFKEASEQMRLYGSACLFPVLKYQETGRDVAPGKALPSIAKAVALSNIVVHPAPIPGDVIDDNINSPNYRKPVTYFCGNVEIHHSRLIMMSGDKKPFMESIAGYLRDFHMAAARLHEAARRNAAFVYKADFEQAAQYIQAQIQINGDTRTTLEMIADTKARSAKRNLADNNVLIIGLTEEITSPERQNISELVQAFEQQMYLLSGVTDIPASRLFSLIASGLGQGNFQTMELYSQALDTWRSEYADKALRAMDRFLAAVYGFAYRSDQWTWNNTKAEDMLLKLRGAQSSEGSDGN